MTLTATRNNHLDIKQRPTGGLLRMNYLLCTMEGPLKCLSINLSTSSSYTTDHPRLRGIHNFGGPFADLKASEYVYIRQTHSYKFCGIYLGLNST